LHDALMASFGADSIFQDVSTIRPGEDFVTALTAALDQCDVMLSVIGPRWATARGAEDQPRLQDPGDYVRLELSTALARGKRIIPILVGGGQLPTATALPEDLKPLLNRQAIELRDAYWRDDLEILIDGLGEKPEPAGLFAGRGRFLGLAGAVIVVLGVVIWLALSNRGTPGIDPTAALGSCSPQLQGDSNWTARTLVAEPRGTSEDSLFEAREAGYRKLEPDRWALQVRMKMTNQNRDDFRYHASWRYDGMALDGVLLPLSCYTPLAGGELVDPGLSSESIVGIETRTEPRGQLEIALAPRILVNISRN
jgi:hypothetical protein